MSYRYLIQFIKIFFNKFIFCQLLYSRLVALLLYLFIIHYYQLYLSLGLVKSCQSKCINSQNHNTQPINCMSCYNRLVTLLLFFIYNSLFICYIYLQAQSSHANANAYNSQNHKTPPIHCTPGYTRLVTLLVFFYLLFIIYLSNLSFGLVRLYNYMIMNGVKTHSPYLFVVLACRGKMTNVWGKTTNASSCSSHLAPRPLKLQNIAYSTFWPITSTIVSTKGQMDNDTSQQAKKLLDLSSRTTKLQLKTKH